MIFSSSKFHFYHWSATQNGCNWLIATYLLLNVQKGTKIHAKILYFFTKNAFLWAIKMTFLFLHSFCKSFVRIDSFLFFDYLSIASSHFDAGKKIFWINLWRSHGDAHMCIFSQSSQQEAIKRKRITNEKPIVSFFLTTNLISLRKSIVKAITMHLTHTHATLVRYTISFNFWKQMTKTSP